MIYNKFFLLIFFVCSFSGFLLGIFNNNLYKEDSLQKQKKIDFNNKTTNNDSEINNNDKTEEKEMQDKEVKIEDNEEEKKKKEEEENKKREEEEKKKREEEERKKKEEEEKKKKEEEEKKKREEENSTYHTVHLGLNIDNKVKYPTLVFLTSLFENRDPKTIYDITILTCDNIDKKLISNINSLKEDYGDKFIKIAFINMKNDFRGAITGTHISTAAYYRIAFPSLLPKVDRIIYSDVDVINFKDLTEFYNLELRDDIYVKATLDQVGLLNELRGFGIYTKKYFNSGIMLMNLKSMRRDGIEEKVRSFITSHYLDHHDQTAMNAVYYNNWEILSLKYAIFSEDKDVINFNNQQDKRYMYNEAELNQGLYEPTLIHFAGWVKPWDTSFYSQNRVKGEYWWYYAKISGFYNEILNNYGFNKNKIDNLVKKIPDNGGLIKNNYKKQSNIFFLNLF